MMKMKVGLFICILGLLALSGCTANSGEVEFRMLLTGELKCQIGPCG